MNAENGNPASPRADSSHSFLYIIIIASIGKRLGSGAMLEKWDGNLFLPSVVCPKSNLSEQVDDILHTFSQKNTIVESIFWSNEPCYSVTWYSGISIQAIDSSQWL